MIWLTWRQFRTQAISVYLALAVIAVVLVLTAPGLAEQYRELGNDFVGVLSTLDTTLYMGGVLLVYLLPAAIGVFWGAPMLARELETGTHNLVWNQGITRTRWLTTKLALTGLVAAGAAGLLSLAVSWWNAPIDTASAALGVDSDASRLSPLIFGARGVVPVGYALFALALGVVVGALLRRTVAAMAVTLVVFAAVQVAVPLLARAHVIAPVEENVPITSTSLSGLLTDREGGALVLTVDDPPGAWVLANETVDSAGGLVTTVPAALKPCLPRGPGTESEARPDMEICLAEMTSQGYAQRLTYHPADRFWPLQWIETAAFVTAALLLAAFCLRRIRRRS